MAVAGVLLQPPWSLPDEVLETVLAQLPHNFLISSCAPVCRQWYRVIRNPAFLPWKKLYHRYKLAPESPSSLLLLRQHGGDGSDDSDDSSSDEDDDVNGDNNNGGGGGGGGGVLTAKRVVKRLCYRHVIYDLSTCLVNIIRAVGESHSVPQGTSMTLVKNHRLYQLAQDTLTHFNPVLLPRPHSLWHLATTIVLLSHNAWDVHSLICLMVQPGSLFSPCVVVEGFYSMALFLLHSSSPSIGLPIRYHYQVFYALYLYENDWTALPEEGMQVRQQAHAGQQSIMRYFKRKPQFQYTHEQLRIINHPLQSDNVVKIVAFAGTGKTTTLLQLCQRRPHQMFLLLVYNKSVQEHCDRTFPKKNTVVKTVHSMAYAYVGWKYGKIDQLSSNISLYDLNNFLPRRARTGNRLRRAALAKNTLDRFLNSAAENITLQHVPTTDKQGNIIDDDFRLDVVLADAEAVWAEMTSCSPDQDLPMTQDGQLKLWQLSRPVLGGYDVLMVDEGQDMNPAMLDVFRRQSGAKVIVGDPYQQIYSFRGAVNALESVESTHTFYLTQSFRFGPEVSYAAQCVLETLNKTPRQTLVGGHKRDSFTATDRDMEALCPSSGRRTAYLGRTNLEVYKVALQMCCLEENEHKTKTFVGGLKKFGVDTLMDVYKLSQVERGRGTAQSLGIKNKLIAKFKTVLSLKTFASNLDDLELFNKVQMYEHSRNYTPRHIQLLKKKCSASEDIAQISFSTIHKAKGLEWDHVVLLEGSSLRQTLSDINDPTQTVIPRDEMNLLYVSVTRAKTLLTLNSPMLEVLRLCKERMEVLVAGVEVGEGCGCVQCGAPVEGYQPLVTKVVGMEVTGKGRLSGGLLCHQCSTQPFRAVLRGRGGTTVDAVQPRQDYSRCARRQLMCGQLQENYPHQ